MTEEQHRGDGPSVGRECLASGQANHCRAMSNERNKARDVRNESLTPAGYTCRAQRLGKVKVEGLSARHCE